MMTEKTPPALGDDWPAIAAHAAHHDITNPAGALASWRALNEDRRIAWRASADAVRMLLDAKPAPDPRVHALDPTETHEQLLEEILRNADEDINGGDEAAEYLAEQYVRFLERERDKARAVVREMDTHIASGDDYADPAKVAEWRQRAGIGDGQ